VVLDHQLVESVEVVTDVFSNRSMRASSCLDGSDAVRRQRVVALKELRIFSRENIVGYDAKPQVVAQRAAEGVDERSLAATDWAPNAHREGSLREVPTPRRLPTDERPGLHRVIVRMRVRMPCLAVIVPVRIVLMSHELPQL
jgi:hypothetical protein